MKTTRDNWQRKHFGENVMVTIDPDDSYDPEFLDCDESIRAALKRSANRYGVYYMTSQYRCPCCNSWVDADSIGGMIYSDIWDEKKNCYLPDLINEASRQLAAAQAKLNP